MIKKYSECSASLKLTDVLYERKIAEFF